MSITVYGGGSPNVHKVEIMLHELGLDFDVRVIDLYRGENFSDWYTAINPVQKVPALTDTDGPHQQSITIFDSGAILIYLAEKSGKFLPEHGAERFAALQWLMFQMSAVGPLLGQLMRFSFPPAPAAEDDFGRRRSGSLARRVYDTLEDRLAQSPFLAGDSYTIADVATYAWTRLAPRLLGGIYPVLHADWDGFPNLRRWGEGIAARPAVERALTAADSRRYTRELASEEELDRLFDRGKAERSLMR